MAGVAADVWYLDWKRCCVYAGVSVKVPRIMAASPCLTADMAWVTVEARCDCRYDMVCMTADNAGMTADAAVMTADDAGVTADNAGVSGSRQRWCVCGRCCGRGWRNLKLIWGDRGLSVP